MAIDHRLPKLMQCNAKQLIQKQCFTFDTDQSDSRRLQINCELGSSPPVKRIQQQFSEADMAIMPSMSSTDHGTTCVKCGELLFIPDWSEFVNEWLVLNLWCCCRCGDRFETLACMADDAEFRVIQRDWKQMFPTLLVA
ncbi:MAG: hypothetical protein P4M05_26710 [Bradyrhizobium sp.]|nr:hypothetical protein [Bradyrhizobium sp.]